jgi:hypothetical protein
MRSTLLILSCVLTAPMVTVAQDRAVTEKVDRTVLPLPTSKFQGVIGKTYKESKEDWPKNPTPPAGAPNIVVILLDDVGFGPDKHIRRSGADPGVGQACSTELAVYALSHNSDLRTLPRGSLNRTKSPSGRGWVFGGMGHRISKLQQYDSPRDCRHGQHLQIQRL